MINDNKLDEVITGLVRLLHSMPFTVEFVASQDKAGIKIIIEMPQDQLDASVEKASNKK